MGRCLAGGRVFFSVFQKIRRVRAHSLMEGFKPLQLSPTPQQGGKLQRVHDLTLHADPSHFLLFFNTLDGQQVVLKNNFKKRFLRPRIAGPRLVKLGACDVSGIFL